ncbi:MAG TPA: D-2-hydroxyacid dehydrogenase [Thermomicrobiales bacterium]|nr:D-2-hydroxyacid dehydrogenase [Thermomicrobiales bacterium]
MGQIVITSPLEDEHLDRIRSALPSGWQLLYEPDLLPPTRYVADHTGPAGFTRTAAQEGRFQALLVNADILFDFPYSDRHPREYAPRARWIQTTSAGVGQAARRLGIAPGDLIITTSSGVHARPLAEFVFMVLLMAVKRHALLARDQQARRWERFCADELTGKTLAIIGPGHIGREIARIARTFDMTPVAMGRDNSASRAIALGVDRLYVRDQLHDMLASADALVVCAPHTPETENLIGAGEFQSIKRGAIFINIARGQLVDESALLAALRDGTVSFAGLDVFRSEPLSPESPFWDMPNVLVNPHSASTSYLENGRIVDIFLHNLACFVEDRIGDMRNVLDIERMY